MPPLMVSKTGLGKGSSPEGSDKGRGMKDEGKVTREKWMRKKG